MTICILITITLYFCYICKIIEQKYKKLSLQMYNRIVKQRRKKSLLSLI